MVPHFLHRNLSTSGSRGQLSNATGARVMSLVELKSQTVTVCWRDRPMPFEHLIETVQTRGLSEQEKLLL